jgi:hypothetical protein
MGNRLFRALLAIPHLLPCPFPRKLRPLFSQQADPGDVCAQSGLICAVSKMIAEELPAEQNGGSARVSEGQDQSQNVTLSLGSQRPGLPAGHVQRLV